MKEIKKLFNSLKSSKIFFFFIFLKYLSKENSNVENINIIKYEWIKISVRKINLIKKLVNYLINIIILIRIKLIKGN